MTLNPPLGAIPAAFPLPLTPAAPAAGSQSTAQETDRETLVDRFVAQAKGGLQGGVSSFRALPGFLYPAISATASEKAVIVDALSRLPLKDVAAIDSIRMVPWIGPNSADYVVLGATRVAVGDMTLSRGGHAYGIVGGLPGPGETLNSTNAETLRFTVIHEMGHAHDFQGGIPRMVTGPLSNQEPFGHGPFTTDYAGTSKREDFAEAYAHHFQSTDEIRRVPGLEENRTLREMDPQRDAIIEKSLKPNFMERLVDHEAFRETGKQIGAWSSHAPLTRPALQALSIMSALTLLSNGAIEVATNVGRDNITAMHGALSVAAGVGLSMSFASPLLGPAALAALGARRGIEVAEKQGVYRAAPTTAAAVGGALGGLVGGVAGPLGGTVLGYAVGGPVGGAIGLITGALTGFQGGAVLGSHAGLALARH